VTITFYFSILFQSAHKHTDTFSQWTSNRYGSSHWRRHFII